MSQQPMAIIGAGIGGLTLARCLLKRGIPHVLYERTSFSASRHNYGITLHAYSYRPLLKILDIDEPTFKRRIAVDGAIGGTGEINPKALVQTAFGPSSFRANRGKLEQLLREGLDVQWDHAVEKVEKTSSGSGVDIHLKDRKCQGSTCLVGADGAHSNIRNLLVPDTPLNILPFVAFNGKRRISRSLFDSVYAPSMRSNVVETKRGDIVLNVSVNDITEDQVSVSWIYSRPSRGPKDALHKPNRPKEAATDIPEEFFQEIGALGNLELEQPFKDIFHEGKLRKERVLHWLMRAGLVGLEALEKMGQRGVFLIGEAAHTEPILGGHGANEAIRDGVELAECIVEKGAAGISDWYEARYPAWETGVRRSEQAISEMHNEQRSSL